MPNMQIQPFTGLQNPQQPIGGLLTAGFNPYPQASLNAAPAGGGLLAGMGPWSQMAYQMAGSPKQGGPYAQVAAPPTPVNTNATGSSGGSTAGSIGLGLLGTVLKNPQLLKSAYNGISGLLGGSAIPASVAAEGNAAAAAANAATGAYAANGAADVSVLPSVSSALDAAPAAGAADAAAGGGLLGAGAGSGAIGAAGANSLAASGGFATGGAAGAGSGGAAAGTGSLGVAGAAIPLAAAAIPFLIGMGATKSNDQGNAAMKAWMQATGATYKANPASAYNNGNTFQTTNSQLGAATNPGTMYDANGKAMTPKEVAAAITAWGKANGVNTGNFNYSGG